MDLGETYWEAASPVAGGTKTSEHKFENKVCLYAAYGAQSSARRLLRHSLINYHFTIALYPFIYRPLKEQWAHYSVQFHHSHSLVPL